MTGSGPQARHAEGLPALTRAAEAQRSRRQRFAMPGGSHDRLVKILAFALPAGVGLVFAFLVLAPFSPRSEVSFLLDRNRVQMISGRLSVESARYRGQDNRGRPFELSAGSAVQSTVRVPIVVLRDLNAKITLDDGPATLKADKANYHIDIQRVSVIGPLSLNAANGYQMNSRDLDIDLKPQTMMSHGPITGEGPAGVFRADRLTGDMRARIVTLEGNARLTMNPGQVKLAQRQGQ